MKIEYDKIKNEQNIAKHGVSFERVVELDWNNSVILYDERKDYGEVRRIGYVFLNNRMHILVWTTRNDNMRLISFRKANRKESKFYETEKNN